MTSRNSDKELQVLRQILSALSGLGKDAQVRILQGAASFLEIGPIAGTKNSPSSVPISGPPQERVGRPEFPFSRHEEMTPKEFLLEKEPATNVERIACVGYYLAYYRDTPDFNSLDLSKLNTEAAQQKFTNPTQVSKEAVRAGLFVPVSRGRKQLSARGEQFVQALPDREAAKHVLRRMKRRRRKKTSSNRAKSPRGKATT